MYHLSCCCFFSQYKSSSSWSARIQQSYILTCRTGSGLFCRSLQNLFSLHTDRCLTLSASCNAVCLHILIACSLPELLPMFLFPDGWCMPLSFFYYLFFLHLSSNAAILLVLPLNTTTIFHSYQEETELVFALFSGSQFASGQPSSSFCIIMSQLFDVASAKRVTYVPRKLYPTSQSSPPDIP